MHKSPYNNTLRNSYFKCYRLYRKLLKYKKKHFHQTVLSQLDDLQSKDPKTYWKLVNSLKDDDSKHNNQEKSIHPDTWQNYFKGLNTINTTHNERLKTIEENLKQFCIPTFDFDLDVTIKDKEILESSRKLHNNKATGFDTIKNEMLKVGVTYFTPCLRKLFNLIFSYIRHAGQLAI